MFIPKVPPMGSDTEKERPKPKQDSLIKEFRTIPFPLPIWLWNLFVIALYLAVVGLILQFAAILVIGILQFLS